MKKVMYLLEYPIDLPGGAQMSTESLCQGLLSSEFEPIVVCPHLLSKKEKDYRFRILTYPMGENRIGNLWKRILHFARIIRREKPEIIHIQMPESLITYGLLRGLGWFRKSKLIFTDRGMFFGYRKHSMMLMQHALHHANLMLCTTKLNQKLWLQGCSFRPVEVVANTISERFEAFDESKRVHDGFVIGFAGRICEEKNWPLTVRLCRELKEAGISFKIAIVVSVFEAGDDKKVAEILQGMRAIVGEENVESHLDFSQSQMAEFYYGVDVFVMTSRFESFGKAAVEAMSRKCAVVSTTVGGLPEVIGKEENLYTEETLEKAVRYIKELSENTEKLQNDQEYFYQRYQQNFSGQKCLEDHLKIYRKMS